jgi:hypothetical protein
MALYFDGIIPTPEGNSKYMAIFYMDTGDKVHIKKVTFGGRGYRDYISYYEEDPEKAFTRRENYLDRHRPRENEFWDSNPMAASALSKWILWNRPTLEESLLSYKRKFKLREPPAGVIARVTDRRMFYGLPKTYREKLENAIRDSKE